MSFTNREIASLILTAVFIALVMIFARNRSEIVSAFRNFLKAFINWKILSVVLAYLVYTVVIIVAAQWLGFWNFGLLKDTLITTVIVGFPLVVNASKVMSGRKLVGSVIREVIGVSALLAFYMGLASFSIVGELILQAFITILVMLSIVRKQKPETRMVARGCDWLLSLIVLGLVLFTTHVLVSTWSGLDIRNVLLSLALSIWLPVLLLPFLYSLAVLMGAEKVLSLLSLHNYRIEPPLRVRLAFLIGIHLSAFYGAHFSGRWLGRLARQSTFRGARREMSEYRRELRRNVKAERNRLTQLKKMSDIAGADDNGLRLDRREFAATKKVLNRLYYMQMGWHRNRLGHFKPDMLEILGDTSSEGLPDLHEIKLKVRGDRQSWFAWREAPSGWFFGIGGTEDLDIEWQYDGSHSPDSFPSEEAGWTDATHNQPRPEWAADDGPIRLA